MVTDGIFSMRGDHAPLAEIMALAARYDERFSENVLVIADDSHGVAASSQFSQFRQAEFGCCTAPSGDFLVSLALGRRNR